MAHGRILSAINNNCLLFVSLCGNEAKMKSCAVDEVLRTFRKNAGLQSSCVVELLNSIRQ